MIYQDLHMHTCYDDGNDSPEAMIAGGIEKNLNSIGITAHSYIPGEDWCIQQESIPLFMADIRNIGEKYKDKITTYCGLEYDILSAPHFSGFDYVIGSVHTLVIDGKKWDIDNTAEIAAEMVASVFNGDSVSAAAEYFSKVAEIADIPEVDIVGHFDLLTKFDDRLHIYSESEEYIKLAYSALDKLLAAGKIFEINSGAMSRGYRSVPYPSCKLLSYISSHGGKICLSSDAHSRDNIAYDFCNSLKLAYDVGFRELWLLQDGEFSPEKIIL